MISHNYGRYLRMYKEGNMEIYFGILLVVGMAVLVHILSHHFTGMLYDLKCDLSTIRRERTQD